MSQWVDGGRILTMMRVSYQKGRLLDARCVCKSAHVVGGSQFKDKIMIVSFLLDLVDQNVMIINRLLLAMRVYALSHIKST